jgi:hypothetical protein
MSFVHYLVVLAVPEFMPLHIHNATTKMPPHIRNYTLGVCDILVLILQSFYTFLNQNNTFFADFDPKIFCLWLECLVDLPVFQ